MTSRLRDLLNVHPGESRMVALVLSIMLLTSAGFTLGSTGAEALFFARYGVQYLPGMYMALGVLSLITSLGITALLGRFRREHLYILVPVGTAVLVTAGWALLFSNWLWVYPLLWLGKEVINSFISLVVWGVAAAVCDTRQSKRLFPLFNAGRILGSVVGGVSAGLLANQFGTQNLLLAWAGLLVLVFLSSRALLQGRRLGATLPRGSRRRPSSASFLKEIQTGFQYTRSTSLFRWISIAAVLFSVLYFSIALPFSQAAAAQYPDEDVLAGFLGLFNGVSTAASFLLSIFVANRAYARFGILNAILALPIIYVLGFAGMAFFPTFGVILGFRFIQNVWLSGMADSAYQAMFNAAPENRRDQVRTFVNGVPEQAGTFLAGAILLAGERSFSTSQLAWVGLITAMITTVAIWKASQNYRLALLESLREGRPSLFSQYDAQDFPVDAAAAQLALEQLGSPDPMLRRMSAYLLGKAQDPGAIPALVNALRDAEPEVRQAALKSLARPDATPALLEIAQLLKDPEPALRIQAIATLKELAPYPRGLRMLIEPLLADPAVEVRIQAAGALLKFNSAHLAAEYLKQLSEEGSITERVLALSALAENHASGYQAQCAQVLSNPKAPAAVRSAAAAGLAGGELKVLPVLQQALASPEGAIRSSAAHALGSYRERALPVVLEALQNPATEAGALLALEALPVWTESARVRAYASQCITRALRYHSYWMALAVERDERICLLADSLQVQARAVGLRALRALGTLSDRATISAALDNLQSSQSSQVANALETLEATLDPRIIRPVLALWENRAVSQAPEHSVSATLEALRQDPDPWLQDCLKLISSTPHQEEAMETTNILSVMERVLLLRRVPLLAGLAPADYQPVAAIAHEHHFSDGEVIFEQGEPGDELYLIVTGQVRVVANHPGQSEVEIARRAAGEVVGEMAIIDDEPRSASGIAVGKVHALALDRKNFESLLRERPEVSLAVMRVLCKRLRQMLR